MDKNGKNNKKNLLSSNKSFGILFFIVFFLYGIWPILSSNELRKQLDKDVKERKLKVQKEYELRQENKRKEVIKQRNQKAYAREQSYIHWVNPYTPINHNKLGSSQAWKIKKKYKYYD